MAGFEEDLVATKRENAEANAQKFLPKIDQLIARDEAAKPNKEAEAPEPLPVALRVEPPKEENSFTKEVGLTIGGAARDAIQNTLDGFRDIDEAFKENFMEFRSQNTPVNRGLDLLGAPKELGERTELPRLPEVEKNQTTTGQVVRGLGQFAVPFLGAMRALNATVKTGNMIKKAAAAGAATDFSVFSPEEGNVSNMLLEMTDQDPAFGKAVMQYLAADPNDPNINNRFKNVLEGLGLGTGAELIFKGVRGLKTYYHNKGADPVESINKVKEQTQEEFEANVNKSIDKDKPQSNTLATEFDAEGNAISPLVDAKGNPIPLKKPAEAPEVKTKEEPKVETKTEPKESVVQSRLRDPEVANIAPKELQPVTPRPTINREATDALVSAAARGDLDSIAKEVDNPAFNMNHIDTEEDVASLLDATTTTYAESLNRQLGGNKKGVKTFDQMKLLAEEAGSGPGDIRQNFANVENLEARVLAARSLLVLSSEKTLKLAKIAENGSDNDMLALRKQMALHATIQSQIKGVQTTIARTLASFRIKASADDAILNEVNDLLEVHGGAEVTRSLAKKIANANGRKQRDNLISKGAGARTNDAVLEIYINGLLSGFDTQLVNIIGNSLASANSVVEHYGAAALGKAFRSEDAIEYRDVNARTVGMLRGLWDSFKITADGFETIKRAGADLTRLDFEGAGRELRGGADRDEFGNTITTALTDTPVTDTIAANKSEQGSLGAITSEHFGWTQDSLLGKTTEVLGAAIRLPGRGLLTADEMFKSSLYRGELHMGAERLARSEGLKGEELAKRISDLKEHPTVILRNQALAAARQGTFTDPLGKGGQLFTRLMDWTKVGRYVVPFIRTPINLVKYTGVRTPVLNLISENVRAEFKAGGARRDMMISKTAIGTAFYTTAAYLADLGLITGGGERDQTSEKLGGWQPYSLKFGDTYYKYNRTDPFGMFFGVAADIVTLAAQHDDATGEQIASMGLLAIQNNLINKTYLQGLTEAFDVLGSSDEGKWQRFLKTKPNLLIPFSGLRGDITKAIDPEKKEVNTAIDEIYAKTPGYSKTIKPQVNLFGEDVIYQGGLGERFVSPFYSSKIANDPAKEEMLRLNLDIRKPSRHIGAGSGSKGIELNDEQYYRYQKLIGNEAKIKIKGKMMGFHEALTDLIQSDIYRNELADDPNNELLQGREWAVQKLYRGYKKLGKEKLFQEFPNLREEFINLEIDKANAKSSRPLLPFPVAPKFQ